MTQRPNNINNFKVGTNSPRSNPLSSFEQSLRGRVFGAAGLRSNFNLSRSFQVGASSRFSGGNLSSAEIGKAMKSIDKNRDGVIGQTEIVDAMLSGLQNNLNLANRTSPIANLDDVMNLVRAIDTDSNKTISDPELVKAMLALNTSGSSLDQIRDVLGQEIVDHILSKNLSNRGDINSEIGRLDTNPADNVISDEEVFTEVRSLNKDNQYATGLTRSVLSTNPKFSAIESLVLNTNFTALNHNTDKNTNVREVFRKLLEANKNGVAANFKTEINSSASNHANVDDVYALVARFDPDKDGVVSLKDFIQAKIAGGFTGEQEPYLTAIFQDPAAVVDFSVESELLNGSAPIINGGAVSPENVSTAVEAIKTTGSAALAGTEIVKRLNAIQTILLTQLPSNTFKTSITTILSPLDDAKTRLLTSLDEASSLQSGLTILGQIKNTTGMSAGDLAALQNELKKEFALHSVVASLSPTANFSTDEYLRISTAIKDLALDAATTTAIDNIKQIFITQNPGPTTTVAPLDDVIAKIDNLAVAPAALDPKALYTLFKPIVTETGGALNNQKFLMASAALQKANPGMLKLINLYLNFNPNTDDVIDNDEIRQGLMSLRSRGITADPNDISRTIGSNTESQNILRIVDQIDKDKDGRISDGEMIRGFVALESGVFGASGTSDNDLAKSILRMNSRYSSYSSNPSSEPLIGTLNSLNLKPGAKFDDSNIVAGLEISLRKQSGKSFADFASTTTGKREALESTNEFKLLKALGKTATDNDVKKIADAMRSLIPAAPASPPFEAGKAAVADPYVKSQLDKIINGERLDPAVESILGTNPNYKRRKELALKFADNHDFSSKSFIKILIQENLADTSKKLTNIVGDIDFFEGLVDTTTRSNKTIYNNILNILDTNRNGTLNRDNASLYDFYFTNTTTNRAIIDQLKIGATSITDAQLISMFNEVRDVLATSR